MALDTHRRELTEAELDLVCGAKKVRELKEELRQTVEDSGDNRKGFGGASSLK